MQFSLPQFKVKFLKLCDQYDHELNTFHRLLDRCASTDNQIINVNEIQTEYESVMANDDDLEIEFINNLIQILNQTQTKSTDPNAVICTDAEYHALTNLKSALMIINATKSQFYEAYQAEIKSAIDSRDQIQHSHKFDKTEKTIRTQDLMRLVYQSIITLIETEQQVLSLLYPQLIVNFYSALIQEGCITYSKIEDQWLFDNYKDLYDTKAIKKTIRRTVPQLKG